MVKKLGILACAIFSMVMVSIFSVTVFATDTFSEDFDDSSRVYNFTGSGIQNLLQTGISRATVTTVSNPDTSRTDKALKYSINAAGGTAWLQNATAFTPLTTGKQILSVDLYVPSNSLPASGDLIQVLYKYVDPQNNTTQEYIQLRNTQVTPAITETTDFPRDQWFTVQVVFDFTAGTYSANVITNAGHIAKVYQNRNIPSAIKTNGLQYFRLAVAGSSSVENIYCDNLRYYTFDSTNVYINTVSVSGTGEVGQTLTASYTLLQQPPNEVAYQWFSAPGGNDPSATTNTAIPGATGPTYTVTDADRGKFIKCSVAAKNTLPTLPDYNSVLSNDYVYINPMPLKVDFNHYTSGAVFANSVSDAFMSEGKTSTVALTAETRPSDGADICLKAVSAVVPTSSDTVWIESAAQLYQMNAGIHVYTTEYYIPSVLPADAHISMNLYTGSAAQIGFEVCGIKSDVISVGDAKTGIQYPVGEWFAIKLIYSSYTGTYDVNLVTDNNTNTTIVSQNVAMPQLAAMQTYGIRRYRVMFKPADNPQASGVPQSTVYFDNITGNNLTLGEASLVQDGNIYTARVPYTASAQVAINPLKLILASYNGSNMLDDIQISDFQPQSVSGTFEETITAKPGCTIKAMFWDNLNSMHPVKTFR